MIRNSLLALTLTGMALSLSARNTVRGVGQDLESAANSVDKAI